MRRRSEPGPARCYSCSRSMASQPPAKPADTTRRRSPGSNNSGIKRATTAGSARKSRQCTQKTRSLEIPTTILRHAPERCHAHVAQASACEERLRAALCICLGSIATICKTSAADTTVTSVPDRHRNRLHRSDLCRQRQLAAPHDSRRNARHIDAIANAGSLRGCARSKREGVTHRTQYGCDFSNASDRFLRILCLRLTPYRILDKIRRTAFCMQSMKCR